MGHPLHLKGQNGGMGDPGDTFGVARSLANLNCQTTGGQRFEHLAAKRDWHCCKRETLERISVSNGLRIARLGIWGELGMRGLEWEVVCF